MKPFCLEVRGDYACFTRPEMKVERVSYDLITPSAARAVFEAVLWKRDDQRQPAFRWRMRRIDVLNPVRWISVRRNEIGEVISSGAVQSAMKKPGSDIAIYVDDSKTRQQRSSILLRDVAYRLYADMEMLSDEARNNPGKYLAMFTRRAAAGQCINQPYLGCREFAARFRLVDLIADGSGDWIPPQGEPAALEDWTSTLGWMLHDMDFSNLAAPRPSFFRAQVNKGVVDLSAVEVRR